jgi:hypothetical protein
MKVFLLKIERRFHCSNLLRFNGEYVKGIGIRDDKFFLISENENDEMYLGIMLKIGTIASANKFNLNQLTSLLAIEKSIQKQMDMLS